MTIIRGQFCRARGLLREVYLSRREAKGDAAAQARDGVVNSGDTDRSVTPLSGGCRASSSIRRLEQRRPDTIDARSGGSTEMDRVRGLHQPRIAFGIRDDASGCGRFASADALGRLC